MRNGKTRSNSGKPEKGRLRGHEIDRTPPSIGRVSLASRVALGIAALTGGYRNLKYVRGR